MRRLLPAFAVVAVLALTLSAAAQTYPSRKRLVDLSQDIFPHEQLTSEALGTFQKAEIDKWWPINRAAGINAE